MDDIEGPSPLRQSFSQKYDVVKERVGSQYEVVKGKVGGFSSFCDGQRVDTEGDLMKNGRRSYVGPGSEERTPSRSPSNNSRGKKSKKSKKEKRSKNAESEDGSRSRSRSRNSKNRKEKKKDNKKRDEGNHPLDDQMSGSTFKQWHSQDQKFSVAAVNVNADLDPDASAPLSDKNMHM